MSAGNSRFSLLGLIIWVICALFFMYEFLLRTVVGTFEHPVMHALNLDLAVFAILSSTAYQVAYGVMQIPVGVITSRFGLKRTLFGASLFASIAVFCFGLVHQFDSALMFRVLMGIGSSFGFVCLLVAVYEWMPREHVGLFIGLSQFIGTMGPMAAAGPLNALSESAGISWRYVFFGLGLIGMGISALVLLIVKNNTGVKGRVKVLKHPTRKKAGLGHLFSQPQVWLIAVFSGSIYFVIEYLSENSGVSFLMLNGVSKNVASFMMTVIWLGYAVGCPLLGFISDRMARRRFVMIIAGICALSGILVVTYLPISVPLLFLAFFVLGIGASGQSIGFAIMAEQCSEDYMAAGLGLNNAMVMLSVGVGAPVLGIILSHVAPGGNYTVADYQQGYLMIVALISLALVLALFFIKETFCKSTKEMVTLSQQGQ